MAHGIASSVAGERSRHRQPASLYLRMRAATSPPASDKFDTLPPEYSHLYPGYRRELAGVICIADPLREEAADVLKALRGLGIRKAVMMTGDNDRTASVIAKQVGVDAYYAEVLPEDAPALWSRRRPQATPSSCWATASTTPPPCPLLMLALPSATRCHCPRNCRCDRGRRQPE